MCLYKHSKSTDAVLMNEAQSQQNTPKTGRCVNIPASGVNHKSVHVSVYLQKTSFTFCLHFCLFFKKPGPMIDTINYLKSCLLTLQII